MSVEFGEYKGYPTITLKDDNATDERNALKMTFGIKKTKLILDNLDALRKFVDNHSEGQVGSRD
jgi:hypothetical protein